MMVLRVNTVQCSNNIDRKNKVVFVAEIFFVGRAATVATIKKTNK